MSNSKTHHRVTPEGQLLGIENVLVIEPAVQDLVRQGRPDERCKSCAGRFGTVPNGCAQTQADLVKAVVEGRTFMCHQADRQALPCHAWYAVRVASQGQTGTCDWAYSPAP